MSDSEDDVPLAAKLAGARKSAADADAEPSAGATAAADAKESNAAPEPKAGDAAAQAPADSDSDDEPIGEKYGAKKPGSRNAAHCYWIPPPSPSAASLGTLGHTRKPFFCPIAPKDTVS